VKAVKAVPAPAAELRLSRAQRAENQATPSIEPEWRQAPKAELLATR
jgi:hypothetical protein